jgi:hypothetical protein
LRLLTLGDVEFNKGACHWIITALRGVEGKEQDVVFAEIHDFAAALDDEGQRPALISAIRLLGEIGRPQARKWLSGLVSGDHNHSVRFHALVALLHCLRGEELQKEEFARLMPLLEEPEFSDIGRLTLELLEPRLLPEELQPALSRLLESPHVAVQKFALRKMGEFGSPAVVRTLLRQLGDSDYARRDTAAHSLRKIPAARAALSKEFLACDDPSKAWTIAEILSAHKGHWRRDTLDEAWQRLRLAVEAGDRIQTAFLHFLKSASLDYVYTQLASCGAQLKKARRYKEATRFLTLLKEFPDFKSEDKFILAVTQLKQHTHDVAVTARRHDPALELLVKLHHSSAFSLLDALKKEKDLTPDDLIYLGFCFAEGSAEERPLGEGILRFLAHRSPRTKIGKSAKNKLRLLTA